LADISKHLKIFVIYLQIVVNDMTDLHISVIRFGDIHNCIRDICIVIQISGNKLHTSLNNWTWRRHCRYL